MGIESDQLVYDYLGKVGDLAQRQGLLSGDRVRLVSELRAEIDRRRAAAPGGDSPAAVKKLLAKIGTPAEVVTAAGGRPPGAPVPIEPTHIEPGPGSRAAADAAGGSAGGPGDAGRSGSGRDGARGADAADRSGIFSAADQATRAAREKLSRLTDLSALTANLTSGFSNKPTTRGRDERPGDRSARAARPETPTRPAQPPTAPPTAPPPPPPAQPPGPRLHKDESDGRGEPAAGDAGPLGFAPAPPFVPAPRHFRPPGAAAPPHLAGEDELGPRESNPDWWRTEQGPMEVNPFDGGVFAPQGQGPGFVDGFVGGIELPELLKPPADPDAKPVEQAPAGADGPAVGGEAAGAGKTGRRGGLPRRVLRRVLRRGGGDGGSGEGGGGGSIAWLAVLAALFLVGGAAFGSWLALGMGYVLAYNARSLSRGETNFATMGVPSLAVFGGLVWLWGRFEERWGAAIPEDGMSDALADTAPSVIRSAAIGSALYLVWRVQRKRRQG
ncbi:hypothetical protein ACMA1D_21300 [Streptomyces sp. 796.1]|uniref:hypothetical protein n=1 Tax=Streptomyces sp. 796.1 TaxID=3163029 RepID=UPI0039C9BCE9